MRKHIWRKHGQLCHAHQEGATRVGEDCIQRGVVRVRNKNVFIVQLLKLNDEQQEEKDGDEYNCQSGNCCHIAFGSHCDGGSREFIPEKGDA